MTDEMNYTENKTEISPEALAHLGDGEIAYVKTIRSEDVPALFPAGARNRARAEAFCAPRRRRHADHADRQPRGRRRERLEPGAGNGERTLIRDRHQDQSSEVKDRKASDGSVSASA